MQEPEIPARGKLNYFFWVIDGKNNNLDDEIIMYVNVNMLYASNTECCIVQKMLNKKSFQSINQSLFEHCLISLAATGVWKVQHQPPATNRI